MIQLVVFDMAGTTIDEQNVVYKTIHKAIEQAGFVVSLETVLLCAAGKEKFQAICEVLAVLTDGEADLEMARGIHRAFERLLDDAYSVLTPLPMPGVIEVFKALRQRDIRVVLNTGYKRPVAALLLQKIGWEQHTTYDLLITADEVANSRPHPDMILAAMDHFGIQDANKVAKIGDSIADIEEGKNAGCRIYAGITTGAQNLEQLRTAQPTHIFDQLQELLAVIF